VPCPTRIGWRSLYLAPSARRAHTVRPYNGQTDPPVVAEPGGIRPWYAAAAPFLAASARRYSESG